MSAAPLTPPASDAPLAGAIAFAPPPAPVEGLLAVAVDLAARDRRSVADRVTFAVESTLAVHGGEEDADEESDPKTLLVSQLTRTLALGFRGLGLVFSGLSSVCDEGLLGKRDAATLQLLCAATKRLPLQLFLGADATEVEVPVETLPLRALLGEPEPATTERQQVLATETPAPASAAVRRPATKQTVELTAKNEAPPVPPYQPTVASITDVRGWASALTQARGPQALATLEQLCLTNYLPLRRALLEGHEDERLEALVTEFGDAFGRVYGDAFPTFAHRTNRPKMTFDLFNAATARGREHDARTTVFTLVDSLRVDLGRDVGTHFRALLGGRAKLIAEQICWSTLPATTAHQLRVLARPELAFLPDGEPELGEALAFGKAAEIPHRLRVGSRDIFKLDLIEARLATTANGEKLHRTAHDVARILATHASDAATTKGHRVLYVVFGDHGFGIDKHGNVRRGGTSPEEILVPAQFWTIDP
jgi:hypothetical protein